MDNSITSPITSALITPMTLPKDFNYVKLTIGHEEQLHKLIADNYITESGAQISYSLDYIKWLLKFNVNDLCIGICYKENLIGCIVAAIIDVVIYDISMKVPHIMLLCVRKKLRKIGISKLLIQEIRYRLKTYNSAIYFNYELEEKPILKLQSYSILINLELLKKLKICPSDAPEFKRPEANPLHATGETDLKEIVGKVNEYSEKFSIRHVMTYESACRYLMPKKRICYSFVKRGIQNEVTDFAAVYIHYQNYTKKKLSMCVGNLSYYFHTTLDINELIIYLIDKLIDYGIDQLNFTDNAINKEIDLIRYRTATTYKFYASYLDIKETSEEKFWIYHF